MFGVGLTFPFVGACHMPPSPCLLLWIPYDGTCGVVMTRTYAAVYLLGGAVYSTCYSLHGVGAAVSLTTYI